MWRWKCIPIPEKKRDLWNNYPFGVIFWGGESTIESKLHTDFPHRRINLLYFTKLECRQKMFVEKSFKCAKWISKMVNQTKLQFVISCANIIKTQLQNRKQGKSETWIDKKKTNNKISSIHKIANLINGWNHITDKLIALLTQLQPIQLFLRNVCTWMARTHVALFENHRKKMKI